MDYSKSIRRLEDQTAHVSEQVLLQQERHRSGALDELQQSIVQISEDSQFVKSPERELKHLHLDPRGISEQVAKFAQLAELLKVTHLEQEALDNFLRYTISNDDQLLDIKSTNDPRYSNLSEEVIKLETNELNGLEAEIEELNTNINEQTTRVVDVNETVKETCLEVSNIIDNCWKLVDELEVLSELKKKDSDELSPLEETYRNWKAVNYEFQQEKYMLEQLHVLEGTRSSLKDVLDKNQQTKTADLGASEDFITYQLLSDLWKKQFIEPSKITNVDLYPRTGKVQFEANGITYVMNLEKNQISGIQAFSDKILHEQILNHIEQLNNQFIGTTDVRLLLETILAGKDLSAT